MVHLQPLPLVVLQGVLRIVSAPSPETNFGGRAALPGGVGAAGSGGARSRSRVSVRAGGARWLLA